MFGDYDALMARASWAAPILLAARQNAPAAKKPVPLDGQPAPRPARPNPGNLRCRHTATLRGLKRIEGGVKAERTIDSGQGPK